MCPADSAIPSKLVYGGFMSNIFNTLFLISKYYKMRTEIPHPTFFNKGNRKLGVLFGKTMPRLDADITFKPNMLYQCLHVIQ